MSSLAISRVQIPMYLNDPSSMGFDRLKALEPLVFIILSTESLHSLAMSYLLSTSMVMVVIGIINTSIIVRVIVPFNSLSMIFPLSFYLLLIFKILFKAKNKPRMQKHKVDATSSSNYKYNFLS
jgi:hypothetical protein